MAEAYLGSVYLGDTYAGQVGDPPIPPDRPVLTATAASSTSLDLSAPYSHPDGDAQDFAEWQVADIDGSFVSPEYDELTASNLTSTTATGLAISNKMARVRQRANGVWSLWSETVYVATDGAPFDPRTRGDAAVWIRPLDLLALGYADTDPLPAVPNAGSDSNITITQPTAGNRPILKTGVDAHGHPSIKFVRASSTFLAFSDLASFTTVGPGGGQMTWLFSVKRDSWVNNNHIIGGAFDDTAYDHIWLGHPSSSSVDPNGSISGVYYRAESTTYYPVPKAETGVVLIGLRQTGADVELYYHASMKASAARTPVMTRWQNPALGRAQEGLFGAQYYAEMHLLEAIGWREAVSDDVLAEAWLYLQEEHGGTIDSAPAQPTADFDNLVYNGVELLLTSTPPASHERTWYRIATDSGMTSLVASVQASSPNLTAKDFTGLDPETTYYFDLGVRAAGTWSPRSAVGTFTTPAVPPANAPPDAPTATPSLITETTVRSTLSAFSDPDVGDAQAAHQHRIRRTSDSAIIETSPEIAGTSNVYDFGVAVPLVAGETYEISGRQKDDSGDAATEWSAWGAWSDPASTTPAEIGPTEIVLDSPTIPPPARVTRAELLALVEPEPPDLEADASILAALATRPQDLEADQVIMAAIVENPVVPATEPCPLEWWDLTVFEDDDVTPILGTADLYGDPVEPSFTTLTEAQGGVRPYLEAPDTGPDESVDPVQCSARISALTVTVLDKRTDPCDQATGVLTAALPDAGAVSQFIGHRALVRRLTSNLEIFPLLDGVVSAVRLNADKVSFDIYLKDLHERPRRTDLFTNNRSISIFPEGLTDGYGWSEAAQDYLIPAADEATGTFHIELLGSYIQVTGSHASDPISDVMAEVGVPDDEFHFPNLFLRWRQAGLAHELDPWNEIPGEHLLALNRFSFPTTSAFSRAPGGPLDIELGPELGYPTPSDGEDIVFQLLYNGATSEDFPYFWDNGTVGDLYRAVLDGEFSGGPLGVTYDDAAMEDISAATQRVRFIETEVAKDGLEWLTANVNLPFNILPVLDGDKALSPIFGDFPAAGALPFLDISNIEDLAADWAHEDSNAVGQVRFTYIREALAPTTSTVLQRAGPHTHVLVEVTVTETLPLWRLLVTREVVVEEIDAASSTTVKTDPLEIKPVTVRVFGTLDDAGVLRPLTTLADEWPYQLARSRGQDLIDRYKFGAPLVSGARASRSDPYVLAARTGDWFSVDLPWLPNYTTGQRGGEMIGQILSFQDVDYSVRSFGLVILPLASLTALDPPVIDTVALNASGQVEVTLSDLGGGTTARVQIILGPGSGVEPAEDDPHWNTIALLTSTADTATSNVLPGSGEYWVRARSEQSGYRPSAWTAAVEIDGPSTPLLWIVRVEVDDDDGSAVVKWLVADEALAPGIRVYYVVHDVGAEPVFDSSTDYRDSAVDANTPTNIGNIYNGSLQLPGGLVGEGQAITVHVEPWSEYPIGGTMGTAVEAYDIRGGGAVVLSGAWVERTADGACDNTELLTHTVHWSIEASYSGLTVTIERAVDGGAWAAVATGQDASTSLDTSWDDTFPTGIVHDTSEGTEHGYIYRASIVRTSDGAVVSRRISDEVLTSPYVCAEGVAARPDLQPGA